MNNIGQKIKKIRELKNLSQEYMAEQLELTQSAYSKLEHNGDSIPYKKIEKIAIVFKMKPEHIINFDVHRIFHLSGSNEIFEKENAPGEGRRSDERKKKSKQKDAIIKKLKGQIVSLKKRISKR